MAVGQISCYLRQQSVVLGQVVLGQVVLGQVVSSQAGYQIAHLLLRSLKSRETS